MKLLKITLFIGSLLLIFTQISHAQTHSWTRTNPGGGGAFSTIGASATGIILAGSDLSGAYRSSNNGSSWDVIGVSKGMTETHVSGVGFHRTDGNILYIGTENGIFRSSDGGNSVSHVLQGGYMTDIEFGTNVLTTGYASYHPQYNSNQGVIYKSTNNGMNWSQISTNLPGGLRILKIIINPNDVNTVYALSGAGRFACGDADLFRSTNGGVNWTNLTAGLSEILDFAIDPSNPDNVFVTTMNANCAAQYYWTDLGGDFYKSTNSGTSWNLATNGRTGVILVDPANSMNIRLVEPRQPFPWISDSGTWTSTNGGSSFTHTGLIDNWDVFYNESTFYAYSTSFNGICKTIGEDLSDPNNLLWVTSQWVFRSTDHGNTFDNLMTNEVSAGFWQSTGFDNVNMSAISISKADPNIIYLGFFDMGIWRSLDHGQSWQSCNHAHYTGNWDGFGGNCATLLSDPDRSNVVWASSSENQDGENPTYLIKSSATGEKNSWSFSNSGLPQEDILGLSLDPNSTTNNRTLYVTAEGDVYKSSNDGASWSMSLNCNGCRFTAVDEFNGDVVYAGGGAGLWRSNNGGGSWTNVSHANMTSSGSSYWDGNYDGVFDVKTDPNNANWVYVTALGSGKGLYKSIDRGDNWTKLLTDDYMRKVAIMPQNSNIIYATSSSAFEAGGYDSNSMGVLFSSDGGDTWDQQNQGMAYPFAMAVEVDNTANPDVFVGSSGTGFQYSAVDLSMILPVDYLAPLQAVTKEDKVLLSWASSSELNNDYFQIQRSADGRNWANFAKVEGKGSSGDSQQYQAYDSLPLIGLSYYRLQQFDTDGSFSYSNIAPVYFKKLEIDFYPNPTKGELNGSFSLHIKGHLSVMNLRGQLVHQQTIAGQHLDLDLSDLPSGVYFIKVQTDGFAVSRKVVLD